MGRVALAGAVLVAALAATTAPPAATTPSVTIHAEFRQIARATYYTLITTGVPNGEIPVVFWKLDLVQVDANGQVDATCNKTENGATQGEFIWHHGDNEGCDHRKEGDHGHQGRITATVHMRDWDCVATYDGSTGVPPDGPTKLCVSNEPSAANGPCDDESAKVAQLDAEIAVVRESLQLVRAAEHRASWSTWAAEYAYYDVYYSNQPDSAVWAAWSRWDDAYREWKRLKRSLDGLYTRLDDLIRARAEAGKAASQCTVKAPRDRLPAARCTSALLSAAAAQGRAAGYALVGSRLGVRVFTTLSSETRALAGRLRAVAPRAPAAGRARLLADARRADASAAALAASARGLATIGRKQVAATANAGAARATLAACRSG